jgi:hypothetical protein
MVRVRIRLAKSGDCRALAELRYRFHAETGSVTETESQFVRRPPEPVQFLRNAGSKKRERIIDWFLISLAAFNSADCGPYEMILSSED